MMRTLYSLSFGLILLNTCHQKACAGIRHWLALIPALTAYSAWSVRQKESFFYLPIFKPFIPESIVRELKTLTEKELHSLPLPPPSENFPVQGGWIRCDRYNQGLLVVDCRTSKPDTCTVYWNCPSCHKSPELLKWYRGQAVTKLGEVVVDSKPYKYDYDEWLRGTLYDPEQFKMGKLEKVNVALKLQGDVQSLKLYTYNPVTGKKLYEVRFVRSRWLSYPQ